MADNPDGGSFDQYLRQTGATRIQAARLFSVVLGNLALCFGIPSSVCLSAISVLCGEGRIRGDQKDAYGEINLSLRSAYDPMKQQVPDTQHKSYSESMESDMDEQF